MIRLFLIAILVPILAAGLAAPSTAGAAEVPRLYGAEVPVDASLREPDEQALRDALAAVLVKLSGQPDIGGQPAAQPLLDRAEEFLQQHGFSERGLMYIGFEARALREAVLDAGLPFWGEDRPLVMVWLALDRGADGRELIGADDRSGVREAIEADAARRGLPVVFPLLDSTDLAQVTVADVWGRFPEPLAAAAARYNADAMLIGRATADALGGVFVRWRWQQDTLSDEWQGPLSAGIDGVADRQAQRFASVASGETARIGMTVSNISSLGAYGEVNAFLSRLSLVDDVSVTRVYGTTVDFVVTTRAERAKLHRRLSAAGFLDSASGQPFDYTYRGSEGATLRMLPGDRTGADDLQ